VGLEGGQPANLPGRSAPLFSLSRSYKSVEAGLDGRPAIWLGRQVNTWHGTDLIKLVTPPWTPINTLLPMKFKHDTLLVVLHL
jgi:hypothetical protein